MAASSEPDKASARKLVRPRAAATLIIVAQEPGGPKILMGKRHANVAFMPGKFVFPGGRIERADYQMAVAGALPSFVEERLLLRDGKGSAVRARALALAAIRETFEETGLLLGTSDYGAPERAPAGAWSDFAAQGIYPSLEGLHLIARAITPPRMTRRFDARFFCVDSGWIAGQVEGKVGANSELTELVWVPLAEAMQLDLADITKVVLRELDERLQGRLAHYLPVPFHYERRGRWFRELL